MRRTGARGRITEVFMMLLMLASLLVVTPLRSAFVGSAQICIPTLLRADATERDLSLQALASARRTLCVGPGGAVEIFKMLFTVEALIFKDWHRLTSWHNGITSQAAYLRTF